MQAQVRQRPAAGARAAPGGEGRRIGGGGEDKWATPTHQGCYLLLSRVRQVEGDALSKDDLGLYDLTFSFHQARVDRHAILTYTCTRRDVTVNGFF